MMMMVWYGMFQVLVLLQVPDSRLEGPNGHTPQEGMVCCALSRVVNGYVAFYISLKRAGK